MARHAKKSDRSAAIRTYLGAGITAGVAGAAFAGVGALTLIDDAQAPTEIQVQLVSNEEELLFLSLNGGSDRKEARSTALIFDTDNANPAFRPIIGPGGWLIGNGIDAAEDCEGDACNGGDGGLLWGNGGNGANGGDGGNAGFWFGNGGAGADGAGGVPRLR